jgi:SAM-dependent methyltransferase
MSSAAALPVAATPPAELFDELYLRFWAAELEGARLEREIKLVRGLGRLAPGGRVLDIACGFGRMAVGLAGAGIEVTGVDISPALLEEARRRAEAAGVAIELRRGDMRELGEIGSFECALLWFTSFGYFSDDENRCVLEQARRCLAPGGRLLIETRHWDRMCRRFEPTTVRWAGRDALIERHRYDPLTGVQHTSAALIVGDARLERHSRLRRYGVPELRALCAAAGFRAVEACDEHGAPLTPESERCVLVAER